MEKFSNILLTHQNMCATARKAYNLSAVTIILESKWDLAPSKIKDVFPGDLYSAKCWIHFTNISHVILPLAVTNGLNHRGRFCENSGLFSWPLKTVTGGITWPSALPPETTVTLCTFWCHEMYGFSTFLSKYIWIFMHTQLASLFRPIVQVSTCSFCCCFLFLWTFKGKTLFVQDNITTQYSYLSAVLGIL